MENIVKNFNEFVNEELNFERYDDECILVRDWYYYNLDDEIIYGSDTKPEGNYPIIFNVSRDMDNAFYLDGERFKSSLSENDDSYLLIYDLTTMRASLFTNTMNIIKELRNFGIYGIRYNNQLMKNGEKIQNAFSEIEDYKMLLLVGNSLIASSFDIIEEN